MEESKELQGFYRIFRSVVYISVLMEFFEYAIDPAMLDHWGGILCDIHGRIKRWVIYNDGNLAYSKLATFLLICITCIGTRNKKKLEFNGRKQVFYPIIIGIGLIVLSVWLYGYPMETAYRGSSPKVLCNAKARTPTINSLRNARTSSSGPQVMKS